MSALCGVMVSKLDYQTFTNVFESHWVPHSYGLVSHLSKKLRKLLGASDGVMVSKLDYQTFTNVFESHWVPHSYGLVSHLSKKLISQKNLRPE